MSPRWVSNHSIAALAGALVAATVIVGAPATSAAAANFGFTVSPGAGTVGVDDPANSNGYDITPCQLGWSANGGQVSGSIPGTPAMVRFELYPGDGSNCGGGYDGWGNIGGVHFEARGGYANLGHIALPEAGKNGFAIRGNILSSAPVANGRVTVDSFQIDGLQQNGRVGYGSFASTKSKGNTWSGGVGWSGQYVFFVEDTATGRKIQALHHVSPGTIPTIDLDAVCFGFDPCVYMAGGPGTAAGTFHPTSPTRILDTRRGHGISSAVTTGDGRNADPNPLFRLASALNHELQVTGKYGIPDSGVSAVLLNVTAVGAPGWGYLSLYPKPARVGDIFNDQGSFGAIPDTSNLNVDGANAVPNLVLARVGAGGKIRINNSFGPTDVIADIAGWFGTGGAHTGGAGFEGVVPSRLLDTRVGIGGPKQRFASGEVRTLQVAGVGGVPNNASSVVINVTATGATRHGYVTVYPDGPARPNASNLNMGPGVARANTAVVKVGANGKIRLYVAETDADLIVDVLGSFGPYGGKVTSIAPERFVDSRSGKGTQRGPMQPYQTRTFQVAGVGGVPRNATAVIANLTATNATSSGYLTAWPAGNRQPTSSNLNFAAGQTVPNLVLLKLGSNGQVSVFNDAGNTDVILDVMGYVS